MAGNNRGDRNDGSGERQLMMRREDGRVSVDLSEEEFDNLRFVLVLALGSAISEVNVKAVMRAMDHILKIEPNEGPNELPHMKVNSN